MTPLFLNTPAQYAELVNSVDTVLFDCDGVLYLGENLIENAKNLLEMLRSSGKKVIFVTNNSTKSRKDLKKTFDGHGLEASIEECFGSAYASAVYLSEVLKFPKDKKVYVFGHEGLEEELDEVGISHCGGSDPEDRTFTPPLNYADYRPDPSVGAVLCGADHYINLKKITKAVTYLHNPECKLILTNPDATFPIGDGIFPASGAMSAGIVYAAKQTPVVIGKPSKTMMDAVVAHHHIDPARTLMIGDNLHTDIEFGINSGIRTLLVMTGVTTYDQIYGPNPSPVVPTYVIERAGDLVRMSKE
ncbi:4-nitrophenyl phosphatase [Cryptococcus wingfieldii CBS 7118]|uniref:4-nitrophenylphosphatase n=1 Tax=Cryptococcus wingfieldii CBS 7118 TaxID=1295528 RepID=A0A1E3JCJ8_9TREE|nr:4-nitrophenyl phosphatase [Cryptococcus wingfieldii CBS 7118]ODN98415.1 4-nitrophenyl phosphatase [Cryptococcus wingfieldii CBS 7118]